MLRGEGVGYSLHGLDWGPIFASVVSGLAISLMLAILGIATGAIATDPNVDTSQASGILTGVGISLIIAMLVGSFIGSFVGGRFSRWLDRGSVIYHAVTSWGVATLMSALLFTVLIVGFAGSAATVAGTAAVADPAGAASRTVAPAAARTARTGAAAVNNTGVAANTGAAATSANNTAAAKGADALGGAGWALGLGMLLTLGASFAGWWLGSRKPLMGIEVEDDVPAHAHA